MHYVVTHFSILHTKQNMLISTKMNAERNIEYFVEVGYVNTAPMSNKTLILSINQTKQLIILRILNQVLRMNKSSNDEISHQSLTILTLYVYKSDAVFLKRVKTHCIHRNDGIINTHTAHKDH